ncbi:MAG: N-acetyltransferase [Acidimicrobiia bacterium]
MSEGLVPEGFDPPRSFDGPGFRLEPLGPQHNESDHEAWSTSMDHIHATPGEWGSWPRPMSLEENISDLEMHAREFETREAFTYSILDGDEVIGCLYIYPDERGDTDAYVSSWVRETRADMDAVVWRAVTDWLETDWPFREFRYADRD